MFFKDKALSRSIINTFLYAFSTCAIKVVLGFFLAVYLTGNIRLKRTLRSMVFFPHLVSSVAVGITFAALMHPSRGLFNKVIIFLGGQGINWLGNPDIALFSVIGTDVWKGLGVATVIFISGIQAIDRIYYEAAEVDGARGIQLLRYITMPLCRPAMNSVIILALVTGMKTFDLIKAMTEGGPGTATEVIALSVYKQFAAGYYGLSTAGNVIMLVVIGLIAYPLQKFLISREE
ncbi:carbohydrate ABC transporter permease [Hungatella sp. SB206]|uniref:carbohydrate ABC transporter permease n=1 Tax=Hungatella sp. SB206 TaxID=2937758 RepID=UPI003DA8CA67